MCEPSIFAPVKSKAGYCETLLDRLNYELSIAHRIYEDLTLEY